MALKDSKLGAALVLKCPRCRNADLFLTKNPYRLKKLAAMHRRCPNCDQNFQPEVGFYYGAMWISYLIGIFMSLVLMCVLIFVFNVDVTWAFIAVVIYHLLFSPYLFRFSRALWLSFFVNYHRDL